MNQTDHKYLFFIFFLKKKKRKKRKKKKKNKRRLDKKLRFLDGSFSCKYNPNPDNTWLPKYPHQLSIMTKIPIAWPDSPSSLHFSSLSLTRSLSLSLSLVCYRRCDRFSAAWGHRIPPYHNLQPSSKYVTLLSYSSPPPFSLSLSKISLFFSVLLKQQVE